MNDNVNGAVNGTIDNGNKAVVNGNAAVAGEPVHGLTALSYRKTTYADFLPDGDLKNRLRRLITTTPTDLSSLYQEIAIYTAMGEEAIALYGAADAIKDDKQKITLKLQAMQMFDKAAARKESLSLSAAKIDQHNRTSESVHMANAIITEAIHIAQQTLKEYCAPEVLRHYARRLQDAFKISDGQGEAGVHHAAYTELLMQEMNDFTHTEIPEPEPYREQVNPKVKETNNGHRTPEVIKNGRSNGTEY